MLQAMNTGHEGSLSTAHANSPRDLLSRLETMALMSDVELPVSHVRDQIAGALDLVVHMTRLPDGRRAIARVSAVEGIRGGAVVLQDIFAWRRGSHAVLEAAGAMPSILRLLEERDERIDPRIFGTLGNTGKPRSPSVPGDSVKQRDARRPSLARSGTGQSLSALRTAWPGSLRRLGTILE